MCIRQADAQGSRGSCRICIEEPKRAARLVLCGLPHLHDFFILNSSLSPSSIFVSMVCFLGLSILWYIEYVAMCSYIKLTLRNRRCLLCSSEFYIVHSGPFPPPHPPPPIRLLKKSIVHSVVTPAFSVCLSIFSHNRRWLDTKRCHCLVVGKFSGRRGTA